MTTPTLRHAIRAALSQRNLASAAIPVLLGVSQLAGAQAASNPSDSKSQSLETIVVTGSNIRRVDIETANPVVTIDHAAIQASGKLTLGDLVQQLPSMSGNATNPNVNNGGGTGASTVSLRGLGSQRTLLLINGHRVAFQLQDLNMIPASAVERIEVLTDGSSAVYGSDAVGGVVNVITRTNYQGAEFSADYGISDQDDGQRKGYHFIFGQSTDKGSIIAGVNYNKNDEVDAKNRDFSKNALYMYSGSVYAAGSSRIPTGNVSLSPGLDAIFHCGGGNPRVTRNAGATGGSLSDYHCYNKNTEAFNFQGVGNYDETRAERTGAFVLGNYKLTDNVEAFAEVFHNKTTSNAQVAPLPLDAQTDTLIISAQNYYNPFGITFGQNKATGESFNEYKSRLQTLGDRISDFTTAHDLVTTGLKGSFGESSWNWNADFSYGHLSVDNLQKGYIDYSNLAGAFGPSFKDAAGNIVCGTPGNVVTGCTPINIFNLNDPNTIAQLRANESNPFKHLLYQTREIEAGVNGTLFDLPAGSVQLAGGASHRKEYQNGEVDSTLAGSINPAGSITCTLSQSICSSSARGGYSVKEAYAEVLIPILKDVPFAQSLNIDLGDRFSKYSNFGSTNNWKVALEWRPIEDLLLRGTVSKVFRAPTTSNIFNGPAGSSPVASDPCVGLQGTNAACQFVPGDGSFINKGTGQVNAVATGGNFVGYKVQPEFGKSFDFGFVYDPHWLNGLSFSADLYRIYMENLIVAAPFQSSAQYILNSCFQENGGPFCGFIKRIPNGDDAGQISTVFEPAINTGRLDTKGFDFAAHYRLPETPWGNFNVGFQSTYIAQYDVKNDVGTQGIAGHYDVTFGNFARWRALGNLDWSNGPFSASYTLRYIGRTTVGYANASLGPSADLSGLYNSPSIPVLHFGAVVYHNVSFGYNIEPLNTQVQLGVDNVGDKKPPIYLFENTLNANTDTSTFDVIGRFYFAKITVKF